jgi:hypothetical protein
MFNSPKYKMELPQPSSGTRQKTPKETPQPEYKQLAEQTQHPDEEWVLRERARQLAEDAQAAYLTKRRLKQERGHWKKRMLAGTAAESSSTPERQEARRAQREDIRRIITDDARIADQMAGLSIQQEGFHPATQYPPKGRSVQPEQLPRLQISRTKEAQQTRLPETESPRQQHERLLREAEQKILTLQQQLQRKKEEWAKEAVQRRLAYAGQLQGQLEDGTQDPEQRRLLLEQRLAQRKAEWEKESAQRRIALEEQYERRRDDRDRHDRHHRRRREFWQYEAGTKYYSR